MPRPGGPMGRVNEKSKDFFGTMKKAHIYGLFDIIQFFHFGKFSI